MNDKEKMPLYGVRILDLTQSVCGAVCTKLFADAGADVLKIEAFEGDPLRKWNDRGTESASDGALFQYLCASKRSVIGRNENAIEWVSDADILVDDRARDRLEVESLLERFPAAVLVTISPFGSQGPYASRAATEFTLQGACGSLAGRGEPDRPPLQAGGRIGEWFSGLQAAVAGLAAYRLARKTGHGEHVDVSKLEVMVRLFGRAGLVEPVLGAPDKGRITSIPSILPTRDGRVGMFLMSRQHYNDFVAVIGRPDLEDDEMWQWTVRFRQRREFLGLVHEWSSAHTTEEIIELLAGLKIPVVPIGDGSTLPTFEQCNEIYVTNPAGGFLQPRVPYRISGALTRQIGRAPSLEERLAEPVWETSRTISGSVGDSPERELPLADTRVIDFTCYWAGPETADLLAILGADVIKIESPFRPDPERSMTARYEDEQWWEYSPSFHATNRNRRDIAVDLRRDAGRAIIMKLIAGADVVIENFRPGVLERLGLSWEVIHAAAPQIVLVKMPAFGLSGPWKDRGAFAPTIEQISGMAFTTGYTADEPLIPGGPCDPNAGVHAAFATLAALEFRDKSGEGSVVEVPMFEAGLNLAAEVVIEYSAYGRQVAPRGNRGPAAAPQGVFQCAGVDEWIALAVETGEQWADFARVLDLPNHLKASKYTSQSMRREVEDEIEQAIAGWCASRKAAGIVELLQECAIPAEQVVSKQAIDKNIQLQDRGFLETVKHAIVGEELQPSVGFRFASRSKEQWLTRAAPTLGEHNDEILAEMGLDQSEIGALYDSRVIAKRLLDK